ncbi:hypothetical protein [Pragia fontium]|uniref:hypothetical protein n=1 Tax=Pragia fontium TaxID=82985 RepID=UPI00064A9CA0|nr:hypothetical protein [Pragia fontium]AKJ41133.1 hypothetical protein QQ39_02745 [Pragia fontium]
MNNKKVLIGLMLSLFAAQQLYAAAVPVRTSIEVTAEIASSIQVIYDRNLDVTEGNVQVKLEDTGGYMMGMTKSFHFIGNASKVRLHLVAPTGGGLAKVGDPDNFVMGIGTLWYTSPTQSGGDTGFDRDATVYPTLSDIPSDTSGTYIRFRSFQQTVNYPLGSYSGTYTLVVTPTT